MANIITVLLREVEKGNVYLDKKGNSVTVEKIEAMAKKSYVADLKAGNIDFTKSFNEYLNDILDNYMPVDTVVGVIKDVIKYEEPDSLATAMAEPQPVMPEEVAN